MATMVDMTGAVNHPTCSTCAHWRPVTTALWEVQPGWGYCLADRTQFDLLTDSGGDLVTAPEFYCALHE